MEGGPGGTGSECDQGALCEIPKSMQIVWWGDCSGGLYIKF